MALNNKVQPEAIEVNPRQRFRQLLEDMSAEHPELGAGELADLVGRTLPQEDVIFVQQFLTSEARTILAYELRMHFAQNRNSIFSTIDIQNRNRVQGSGGKSAPVTVADLPERKRQSLYERIEAWREYVPSERRSRALLDMNRAALLDSADFDLQKTYHFGFKGRLKQRLAEGLTNDTVTVSEVYTNEQIVDLTEAVKKEMSRGNFRLKIAPVHSIPSGDPDAGQTDGRHPQKPGGR